MEVQRFIVEKRRVNEIPIWRILPDREEAFPLVILQHGYTGNKDSVLTFGLELAGEGYEVLLPDARLHGERMIPDFNERFAANFRKTFLSVVEGTAEDISTLIDYYERETASIVGISMGAFITYLLVTRDKRIAAAVPLIGSPDFTFGGVTSDEAFETHAAKMNPASHIDLIPPCAMLIQHGELDDLVSVEPDRFFYERLKPLYSDHPERLDFVAFPNAGHEVPQEMVANTLDWLARFAPKP
jgi:dienelactone hydrolase